jgi:hypothetical protein
MSLSIYLRKYYYKFSTLLQSKTSFYANYKDSKGTKKLEEFGHASILTDDIESHPLNPNNQFNFIEYSEAIVSIINGQSRNCSIGIYGEWVIIS